LKEGLEKGREAFLASIKPQIDNFIEKLRTLSAFQFNNDEKVAEKLLEYKLNLQYFSELKSEKM